MPITDWSVVRSTRQMSNDGVREGCVIARQFPHRERGARTTTFRHSRRHVLVLAISAVAALVAGDDDPRRLAHDGSPVSVWRRL
jgi:hypothetical protein